jgi:hypothetical protein
MRSNLEGMTLFCVGKLLGLMEKRLEHFRLGHTADRKYCVYQSKILSRCIKRIPPGSDWKDYAEKIAYNEADLHEIEKIVGKRKLEGMMDWEFLIVWKGFLIQESSWIPA